MKLLFFYTSLLISTFAFSQSPKNIKDSQAEETFKNIKVQKIHGDSLATGFIIWVKDTVKTHKHEFHSEHVYIEEGSGQFYLNDTTYNVQKGDVIFIPKNSWHAVKVSSRKPMKVLSVQSPGFYGDDRIFKDQN